jgi:hypothetical protein
MKEEDKFQIKLERAQLLLEKAYSKMWGQRLKSLGGDEGDFGKDMLVILVQILPLLKSDKTFEEAYISAEKVLLKIEDYHILSPQQKLEVEINYCEEFCFVFLKQRKLIIENLNTTDDKKIFVSDIVNSVESNLNKIARCYLGVIVDYIEGGDL